MRKPLLCAVVAGAILAGCGTAKAAVAATSPTSFDYASVIHSDAGFSVYDAVRKQNVIMFGDTLQVGTELTNGYGYPHWAIGVGSLTNPHILGGYKFGHYGYQPVPDFSDGTYLWTGGMLATPTTIYVYGMRIRGAANFTVVQDVIVRFNAATLAYEGLQLMHQAEAWSNAVPVRGGHWMLGTSQPAGSFVKVGEAVFIPVGDELRPWRWHYYPGVVPQSTNPGTVISLSFVNGHWYALTKWGDAYFGPPDVVELTAVSPAGPWRLTGKQWPIAVPNGDVAYSVNLHVINGQRYVSYAVNGDTAQYYLRFFPVTLP